MPDKEQPAGLLPRILAHPLLRSGGVYFVANVANAGLPFLMLPFLTRYLTPTDYGIVSMFGVLVGILIPFVGVNTHAAKSATCCAQSFADAGIDRPLSHSAPCHR